ncbi:hypothetical protein AC579_9184 [Pseudocercospora musae]|uniref:DUF2423 domain-containing protein n=1 Tax=Pseudocercospora musae TaxID=113226 RepID=A0A139H1G6_9PEZI|nr:hypothetical protein AC579_9184 [Pseudocercospora musae]
MGSSARASRIKKNNSALKKRVFGPVEQARNERLSAKLLALAKAPKEERMDVEQEDSKEAAKKNEAVADVDMDASTKKTRSKREVKRLQEARAQRQERKSRKKARNQVAFPSKKKGGKR